MIHKQIELSRAVAKELAEKVPTLLKGAITYVMIPFHNSPSGNREADMVAESLHFYSIVAWGPNPNESDEPEQLELPFNG